MANLCIKSPLSINEVATHLPIQALNTRIAFLLNQHEARSFPPWDAIKSESIHDSRVRRWIWGIGRAGRAKWRGAFQRRSKCDLEWWVSRKLKESIAAVNVAAAYGRSNDSFIQLGTSARLQFAICKRASAFVGWGPVNGRANRKMSVRRLPVTGARSAGSTVPFHRRIPTFLLDPGLIPPTPFPSSPPRLSFRFHRIERINGPGTDTGLKTRLGIDGEVNSGEIESRPPRALFTRRIIDRFIPIVPKNRGTIIIRGDVFMANSLCGFSDFL